MNTDNIIKVCFFLFQSEFTRCQHQNSVIETLPGKEKGKVFI